MTSVDGLIRSGISALQSKNPGAAVSAAQQLATHVSVHSPALSAQLMTVANSVAAKVTKQSTPKNSMVPPPGPSLNPFNIGGLAAIDQQGQSNQNAVNLERMIAEGAETRELVAKLKAKMFGALNNAPGNAQTLEALKRYLSLPNPDYSELKDRVPIVISKITDDSLRQGYSDINTAILDQLSARTERIPVIQEPSADEAELAALTKLATGPNPNWNAINAPIVKLERKLRGGPLGGKVAALSQLILERKGRATAKAAAAAAEEAKRQRKIAAQTKAPAQGRVQNPLFTQAARQIVSGPRQLPAAAKLLPKFKSASVMAPRRNPRGGSRATRKQTISRHRHTNKRSV